jgi:very-short-patch-repair endonuclease
MPGARSASPTLRNEPGWVTGRGLCAPGVAQPRVGVGVGCVGRCEYDATIAKLADRGGGVVSRAELLAAGVPRHAIDYRARNHRLHECFRNVYAVGHSVISLRGRARAALLSVGDQAALSHLWSLAVHGVRVTLPAEIDLLVPRATCRPQAGIRLHRSRQLDKRDIETVHGLRVTTPERALLDLADTEPPNHLERLLDEAVGLRKTTPATIGAQLDRESGRRGEGAIRELLRRDYSARTREEFERRMLAFIRAIRVEHPLVNHPHGPFVLDFYWPRSRYVIEADSRAWHSTRAKQKRDAVKDRYLGDREIEVRRVRWWELEDEPPLAAEVGASLAVRARAQ